MAERRYRTSRWLTWIKALRHARRNFARQTGRSAQMRTATTLLGGTLLSIAVSAAAWAAAHPPPSPKPVEDCRKVEKEVGILMDARSRAPKISEAKFRFQLGHMQCLEGDDVAANMNYGEVKKLLANDTRVEPGSPPKP